MRTVTLFAAAMTVAGGLSTAQAQFLATPSVGLGPFYGTPGAGSPGQDQRPDFLTGPGIEPGEPYVADSPTTIGEYYAGRSARYGGGYGGYGGGYGGFGGSGGVVSVGPVGSAYAEPGPTNGASASATNGERRRVASRGNRSNARSTTGAGPAGSEAPLPIR